MHLPKRDRGHSPVAVRTFLIRPQPNLNLTGEKLAELNCTGKRELIGFSVHTGINVCGDCVPFVKRNFVHTSSTKLSDLWTARGPTGRAHLMGRWRQSQQIPRAFMCS